MKTKYSKEVLEPIVKESFSMAEVLRKLNLKYSGGNYCHIKKMIRFFKISFTHFTGQGHSKGKTAINAHTEETFIKDILKENGKGFTGNGIKKLLFKFSLKENKCEKCGLNDEWQGEKIVLHLDHINGNHFDNRLENLQILCPNCHSQTITFGGKRFKKEKVFRFCECGKEIKGKASKKCFYCSSSSDKLKKFEVLKEELEKMVLIDKIAFDSIGKMFGVSGNAIRKRCKKLNIDLSNR